MFKQIELIPKLQCVLMAAGLFAVVGHPGHYYCAGRFYRMHDGVLQSTSHWNGRWVSEIPANVITPAPTAPATPR